jgi:cell division protease FtsH
VHTQNKEVAPDVDFNEIATLTSGFSGADLSNLANEAAIVSVRENRTMIDRTTMLNAYEKITIGLPTATNTADPEIISLVSHHEIGHAITAKYFEEFFELRKVTINANQGGAGGYTLFTPKEQFVSYATKKFMLANIVVALGGRAAEVELFSTNEKKPTNVAFQNVKNLDITTGASNDLKQADYIARQYISLFGISDEQMLYKDMGNAQPFLGRELGLGGDRTSEYTKELIDKKVTELISDCYKVADNIIQSNLVSFYTLAEMLIDKRVLDAGDFTNITVEYR